MSSRSSGFCDGNAEGVFHQLGGFFDAVFLGVVEAAEHAARIDLLADLHFENHADGRIDRVFLRDRGRRRSCCEARPMSSASIALT